MGDEVAIVTKAKENIQFAMAEVCRRARIATAKHSKSFLLQLSEKERSEMSAKKLEFIQKCSFNGRSCDIERLAAAYTRKSHNIFAAIS